MMHKLPLSAVKYWEDYTRIPFDKNISIIDAGVYGYNPRLSSARMRVDEVLQRSGCESNARKTLVACVRKISAGHYRDTLDTPSCLEVFNEWNSNPSHRVHPFLGAVTFDQSEWRQFCSNLAYVTQSILRYHAGKHFYSVPSKNGLVPTLNYVDFLRTHMGCEWDAVSSIRNVVQASTRISGREKEFVGMIMRIIFISLFKATQYELFPSKEFLTPEKIEALLSGEPRTRSVGVQCTPMVLVDASVQYVPSLADAFVQTSSLLVEMAVDKHVEPIIKEQETSLAEPDDDPVKSPLSAKGYKCAGKTRASIPIVLPITNMVTRSRSRKM